MAELKRDEIKYVRDAAKSAYEKEDECFICGATENLEFHHFYTLTLLWRRWKDTNSIVINSTEDIIKYRELFIKEHYKELYQDAVTLCNFHHIEKLHKIYGKAPSLHTAEKQKRWVVKQQIKFKEKNVTK